MLKNIYSDIAFLYVVKILEEIYGNFFLHVGEQFGSTVSMLEVVVNASGMVKMVL